MKIPGDEFKAKYSNDAVDTFRINSKTFYFASIFLGNSIAKEAARLYQFCRMIDDIADNTHDNSLAIKEINLFKHDLQNNFSTHPVISDLLDLIRDQQLDHEAIGSLLTGILSDLSIVRIQNEDELLEYCYKVAGTVGVLMCPILGVKDSSAHSFAADLGIAMQLTNICRDIKEDAINNRIYIPRVLINTDNSRLLIDAPEKSGVDARSSCAKLLKLADKYYKRSEYGLAYLPIRSKICVLIAGRSYREIGNKLKAGNYVYWENRVFTSLPDKIWIAIKSIYSLFTNKHYWILQDEYKCKL
jgi:phytoene synthase